MIILAFAVGIFVGLALAALLERATAPAPSANVTQGISALGVSMSGRSGVEYDDPRYVAMVNQVLQRPARGNNWRTLV
jgi:hypothetical protein